jgi:hypothetical protein
VELNIHTFTLLIYHGRDAFQKQPGDPGYEPGPRPEPCHKRVWASLPQEGPEPQSSVAVVFDWLWWEYAQRNPRGRRPAVCLCDGQEALWQVCAEPVPEGERVEVLDLLHVTPRLWQAAKLLYGEKGPEVLPFVRQRVLQVLEGKVETVVRTLVRLSASRGLRGGKKQALQRISRYLRQNRQRMRYDEYLRRGYPIVPAQKHVILKRFGAKSDGTEPSVVIAKKLFPPANVVNVWTARVKPRDDRLDPSRLAHQLPSKFPDEVGLHLFLSRHERL